MNFCIFVSAYTHGSLRKGDGGKVSWRAVESSYGELWSDFENLGSAQQSM